MQNYLGMAGRLAGWLGLAVCMIAGLARMVGLYSLGGIWVGTIFQAGMAAILAGCFLLLAGHPSAESKQR